jgi:hypothetical protein
MVSIVDPVLCLSRLAVTIPGCAPWHAWYPLCCSSFCVPCLYFRLKFFIIVIRAAPCHQQLRPSRQHDKQTLRRPRETKQYSVSGQAASSHRSPWTPLGTWGVWQFSFSALSGQQCRLRQVWLLCHNLLLRGGCISKSRTRELSVSLVKENEVAYRKALQVCTASGTATSAGATVPTVDPE